MTQMFRDRCREARRQRFGLFRIWVLAVGDELAMELRSKRPDLRVLLMSGFGPAMASEQLVDLPTVGFIQKPYRVDALSDKMRRLLRPTVVAD